MAGSNNNVTVVIDAKNDTGAAFQGATQNVQKFAKEVSTSTARTVEASNVAGRLKQNLSYLSAGYTGVAGQLAFGFSPQVIAGAAALGALTTEVLHATKASIDYESAFAGVKKTVSATPAQLAQLRQGFLDLSKQIPESASDLANIGEAAGQLGIETPHILDFTKVIAELGTATNLTGDEGATELARLANIVQMSQGDFSRLGSTIVALGNNGASTESEIAEMALRLAGTGHTIGLTMPQILGMANALSSVGIEAEAGGSAMSRTMQNMAQAVSGGGKTLNAFAKVAGTTSANFAQEFKTDPMSAITAFVNGLENIQKSGGDLYQVFDNLGIKDVRMIDTLTRAAGAGSLMADSVKLGTQAWKDNVALTNEANQRYQTTASQIQILKDHWNTFQIALGDTFKNVVNNFVIPSAVAFIGGLSNIGSKARELWNFFITFFSPLLKVIKDDFANLMNEISTQLLPTLQKLWTQVSPVLIPALKILAGIITTVVLIAIDALIKTITVLVQGFTFLYKAEVAVIDFFKTKVADGVNTAIGVWKTFINIINNVIDVLSRVEQKARNAIQAIKDTVAEAATLGFARTQTYNRKSVNDAVISPSGSVITTHPDDWLIATKNPAQLGMAAAGGGGVSVNITVNGDVSGRELVEKIQEAIVHNIKRELRIS